MTAKIISQDAYCEMEKGEQEKLQKNMHGDGYLVENYNYGNGEKYYINAESKEELVHAIQKIGEHGGNDFDCNDFGMKVYASRNANEAFNEEKEDKEAFYFAYDEKFFGDGINEFYPFGKVDVCDVLKASSLRSYDFTNPAEYAYAIDLQKGETDPLLAAKNIVSDFNLKATAISAIAKALKYILEHHDMPDEDDEENTHFITMGEIPDEILDTELDPLFPAD